MRGLTLVFAILAVLTVAVLTMVVSGRNAQARRMRAEVVLYVERGGLADLARAQAVGRRLVIAHQDDREAAAALAFASAVLAVDYGLDTHREAGLVLERAGFEGGGADVAASPLAAAARALVLLRTGEREAAARLATAAAAATPGTPYPLYALGRIRARGGDMPGAARALKAAIVNKPTFMVARVALAEARLDLGDPQAARAALTGPLENAPDDLRARLLLDEAEQSLRIDGTSTLQAACPAARERWPPPAVRAGCALALAARARRTGARTTALARAEEAASAAPPEPRLLARIAQALSQLGAVDRAATLLGRARRLATADTPALAWAAAAVTLGRGRAAPLPLGAQPADPDNHLLIARIALAAGGVGALMSALDSAGPATLARDVDLRLLARLRAGSSLGRGGSGAARNAAGSAGSTIATATRSAAVAMADDDPVRAYVDGLRARLDGDIPAAVASLGRALSGHGDACRAAGEYVTLLRVLKREVDPAAWNLLRAENASCVNVR